MREFRDDLMKEWVWFKKTEPGHETAAPHLRVKAEDCLLHYLGPDLVDQGLGFR
jgi:hypothetical protein